MVCDSRLEGDETAQEIVWGEDEGRNASDVVRHHFEKSMGLEL